MTRSCPVDIAFSKHPGQILDVDVVYTPGHTNGSVSYVYGSPYGYTYLFTGDSFFQSGGGWGTFVMPQEGGSRESMLDTLRLYRNLNPDIVISSGSSVGSAAYVETFGKDWVVAIDSKILELEDMTRS